MAILSERVKNITNSPTLAVSAKAKELRRSGVDIVGFGAGEPDFDTPSNIKQAGIDAIKKGFTKYTPVSGMDVLKDAIKGKFQRDNGLIYNKAQIIAGCGAKHILYNIFQSICNPEDEVIILSPYWVSYPEMIRLSGAVPVIVQSRQEEGFIPQPEAIEKAITPRTKALLINTPNNPTGAVYPEDILDEIASIAVKNNLIVVSDEVYEKILYGNNRHISIASFNKDIQKRTITVNAVSKTYAMTGWRIGYAGGPEEIISGMARIQSHSTSGPASISQMAATAALRAGPEIYKNMVKKFAERRDYVIERCKQLKNISFFVPQGAFYVFMNISGVFGGEIGVNNSIDFAALLLNKAHTAVVPGSAFGDDRCIRMTFAASIDEIAKGFDRIEKFLIMSKVL